MKRSGFDYVIDEAKTWPPHGKPQPPYGPTTIEIIRSCPLRSCFEVSQGYERRLGFAARVGTAFHRTLQSLMETPPSSGSTNQVAEDARQRFENELAIQLAEVANRPREQGLPRDSRRVSLAIEAAIVEALRVACENRRASPRQKKDKDVEHETISQSATSAFGLPGTGQQIVKVETEVPVQSRDKLFNGRVDRAEYWEDGVRLIDYKSALRDDLPGRYERQLQLYAYMWHETRDEWPVGAQICYPLTGSVHSVSVEPEVCNRVAEDAKALVSRLENTTSRSDLAIPGDTCQVCEFRPWCRPFWKWQNAETSHSEALKRAALGLEGRVESITNTNHYWKLQIQWHNTKVQLVAPEERFPQLRKGHPGMVIRILDSALQGLRHAPNAVISELSEVFLVIN
jgi:CRISPR/Cas system-associated exonuclease Cas4 (RecB family)